MRYVHDRQLHDSPAARGRTEVRQDARPDARAHETVKAVGRARNAIVVAFSLFLLLFVPTTAQALEPGSGPSLSVDMEQLNSDLKSSSTLSNFSTFSVDHQKQDEYALADVAFNEQQLTGSDPMLGFLAAPPVGPALEPIEHYIEDLKTGVESIIPGGPVDDDIGAAIGEEGAAAGMIGAVATLIPIAGYLTYEDITTGSNIVTRALFSGREDHEEGLSPGAEKERWERYPDTKCTISGVQYGVDRCTEHYWEQQCEALAQSCAEADQFANEPYHNRGHEAEGFGEPAYYLEYEVAGKYYVTSLGFYNPEAINLKNRFYAPNESEECFVFSIAGAPANFMKNPVELLVPESGYRPAGTCEHYFKTEGEWALNAKGERELELQAFVDTDTMRAPSRMHIGAPHRTTLPDVETLEREGEIARKNEGHPAKSPEDVKERVKGTKVSEAEGGKRRQKEAYCHWMGCETEYQPAEPESPEEPETPGKAEGVSPAEPGTTEVPSCFLIELSGVQCKELLEERGFSDVEIDVRTWETAVVEQPADAIIAVTPAAGSIVETATKIVVDTNPAPASMPVEVPDPGTETAVKYKERLEREGWTKVAIKIATEPGTGASPGDVVKTIPDPSTRLDPSVEPKTKTEVTIEQQPEGSPEPGLPPGAGFGSPGCGLTPPTAAFNLAPITGHSFGSVFPFSALTWLSGAFSGIATTAHEPHAVLHVFGSEVETGNGFAPLATIFTLLRTTIAAFMWIGVAWFLWNRTLGSRTS